MSTDPLYDESLYGIVTRLIEYWSLSGDQGLIDVRPKICELQTGTFSLSSPETDFRIALRGRTSPSQWSNLFPYFEAVLIEGNELRQRGQYISDNIRNCLTHGDYIAADRLAKDNLLFISSKRYGHERKAAVSATKSKVGLLKRAAEERVERKKRERETQKRLLEEARKRELAQEIERKRQGLEEKIAPIKAALSHVLHESIRKADELNRKINSKGVLNYTIFKSNYILQWLSARLKPPLPANEQVLAIGEMSSAFLLRARAGSGKRPLSRPKRGY